MSIFLMLISPFLLLDYPWTGQLDECLRVLGPLRMSGSPTSAAEDMLPALAKPLGSSVKCVKQPLRGCQEGLFRGEVQSQSCRLVSTPEMTACSCSQSAETLVHFLAPQDELRVVRNEF